jgi:hypothetical protein
MTTVSRQNQIRGILFFLLSGLLTWWFVTASPLYVSNRQMILSAVIAGGKWGVQVLLALLCLKDKKWVFIKNIGWVCLAGSLVLIPYILLSNLQISNDPGFFVGSLIAAVLLMIYCYFKAVKASAVSLKWWHFWLLCLTIAISLQLTIVFKII